MKNKEQKINKLCRTSGLHCDSFVLPGRHKHLPRLLKHAPQHIVYDDIKVRLVYFKATYDDMYTMLTRDEIESVRIWNANTHRTTILVYNYKKWLWSLFEVDQINKMMFKTRKESIDKFLFPNDSFEWNNDNVKLSL